MLTNWFNKLSSLTTVSAPEKRFLATKHQSNPFQQAFNQEGGDGNPMGKNNPFASPRFVGYYGDKAIYAGSKLNVFC
jgi:hypothetical protein